MLEPLEVFAVNNKMFRATGSIPYLSLMWNRKYYSCGEFSMTIPADVYDASWMFIIAPKRPETGIIEKVEYNDNPTYGYRDSVVVSGRFLESMINRRTFLDESPMEITETYYVDPPKAPSNNIDIPEVYQSEDGTYVYESGDGQYSVVTQGGKDTQSVSVGEKHTDSNGNTYFNTPNGTLYADRILVTNKATSYWHTSSGSDTVTSIEPSWPGMYETTNYNVVFSDGGNYFVGYDGPEGTPTQLYRAYGVAERYEDNYWVQKEIWNDNTDEGWVTVTKQMEGPWSITEFEDYAEPQDNVKWVMKMAQTLFPNFFNFETPEFDGETQLMRPSFELVGDYFYKTLQTIGASFRLEYNFLTNNFQFSVWRGTDRTQSQTNNPFFVFSDTWGTLSGYTASRDDSNYRNKCYVCYDYEEPEWEGEVPKLITVYGFDEQGYRTIEGWYIPYSAQQGYDTVRLEDDYDDREISLDCRSDKPECDGDWSRDMYQYNENEENGGKPTFAPMAHYYTEFREKIKAQGEELLKSDYYIVETLDTGDLRQDGYLRDFDLGDKVDMMVYTLDMIKEARITGVEEVYESGNIELRITVGDEVLTILDKARLKENG